jgi:uncharacterized protein (TIGR03435 family)
MRTIRGTAFALFPLLQMLGQAPPEFEVASIRPSPPGQINIGFHVDGTMVRYTDLSLNVYLQMAYGVKNYQISAPDWMASDRFGITAKLPPGSDPKQVPEMLQALLRDRFQMTMHREFKELPVYGLMLGKGELKLKASEAALDSDSSEAPKDVHVNVAAGGSGTETTVSYGNGAYSKLANNRFEGRKLPMAVMADSLAQFADRPVVDMTGLSGNYDFTMEFSPEDYLSMRIRAAAANGIALPPEVLKLMDSSSGDTLFNAVQKLGLKLEPRKAPIEILVIDRAQKTPAGN